MSEFDLVIRNGRLVTATESLNADLAIQGEKIAAIGHGLTGRQTIDAGGMLVTPGAVDVHVHMETNVGNGITTSDDFFTGTRAAAIGGTTAIVDFVDAAPDQPLLDALAQRRRRADQCSVIDYALHMVIRPPDLRKLDELPALAAAGCSSFKLFMAYPFRLDDGQLVQALEAIRDVGGMPVVHAENWDVISLLIKRNLEAGRTGPRWHPRSRPEILEGEAAGRLIDIARFVGVPVHIFHVSCRSVVDRIATAKAEGLSVTGETCPHYLYLTQEAYEAEGVLGMLPVCSPPLRPEAERLALWDALAGGDLDIVSTDHGAYMMADKNRGAGDFSAIPGGVPSIEMRFSALYAGVQRGLFSENRWVEICCTAPADRVGLQNKGRLNPGADADLVIFSPEKRKLLSTKTLHENTDWTPYEGIDIRGWPAMTISRGEVIAREDQFLGEMGRGRYIDRKPHGGSAGRKSVAGSEAAEGRG